MRKIPATMATQHPDNANAPYWLPTSTHIAASDEAEECYRLFCDLDVEEYMWDWEGKFVDEAVVDRLYFRFGEYFKKNQLGRDKFLTFRIPNIWKERGLRLGRAFMGILTAAQTANDFGVKTPPIFEVILPMTTQASQLITILEKFKKIAQYERHIFDKHIFSIKSLDMIPLIEGSISLLDSKPLLESYVKRHKTLMGFTPKYLRPFIARSDPALDAGFVSATLAARGALSEYYRFESETKIPVFPIIGAGSLMFRGGLSPITLKRFINLYSGTRTVTIQSAFRYDYPQEQVKKAITYLNRHLHETEPVIFSEKGMDQIEEFSTLFSHFYRSTVEKIAPFINQFAPHIPKNRERIPHTGHFGYSRKLGKTNVSLPRAIPFVAILSSLGIPPTFIGTGRGVAQLVKEKKLERFLEYFPGFEEDLIDQGRYLNRENLQWLCAKNPAWEEIKKDIVHLESFLGLKLEPTEPNDLIYRNLTSLIFHYWGLNKEEELRKIIREAAQHRCGLG